MVLRTYLFTLCSGTPPTLVFAQSFKGLGCYGRGVNRTGQRLRGTPAQFFFRCGLSLGGLSFFFKGHFFEGVGVVPSLVFAQFFKDLGCYGRGGGGGGVNRTGQRLRGTPAQSFFRRGLSFFKGHFFFEGVVPTLVFAQFFKDLGCYWRGVNRTGQRLRGTPA